MLTTFGLTKGGKEYRRLIAAFERIFGATIFFGTLTSTAKVVHRALSISSARRRSGTTAHQMSACSRNVSRIPNNF